MAAFEPAAGAADAAVTADLEAFDPQGRLVAVVAQDQPWNSKYKINTTPGMVDEIKHLKDRGVLDYTRAAVRLVPDTYQANNPQG